MIPPTSRIIVRSIFILFLLLSALLRFQVGRRLRLTSARIAGDILVLLAWVTLAISTGIFINEDYAYIHWEKVRPLPINNTMEDLHRLSFPFLRPEIRAGNVFFVFIYYTVLWSIKGAFVSLYFDIFGRSEMPKAYRIALWALAGWIGATYITVILYHATMCIPIQRNWDLIPHCSILRSNNALDISFSSNVLTDLPVMLLPLTVIRRLHLSKRQKLGFLFVFALGLLTISMSTVRFLDIQLFKELNRVSHNKTEDYANRNVNLEMWSFAEMWTALLAVCLPSFRVYLRSTAEIKRARTASPETTAPLHSAGRSRTKVDSLGWCEKAYCEKEVFSSPSISSVDEEEAYWDKWDGHGLEVVSVKSF